jgi:predicted  nucleic acid-binding Zn-ribbon protein
VGTVQNTFKNRHRLERLKVTLRDALAAVSSRPQSAVSEARERLRAAQTAKRQADEALAAAVARTVRVREMTHAVADADDEVEALEREAAAAKRKWAAAGAPSDIPACDPALLEQLEHARRAAADARSTSAGAEDALPTLKKAEDEAQYQVARAEGELSAAISAVLAALLEPNFERAARALSQYRQAMLPLRAGALLFKPWGRAHSLAGFSSPEFTGRVVELTFRDFDHRTELEPLADSYAKLGRRLATDPDATDV